MHVVGGGASRAPHGRDDLSLPYPLPLPDLELQTMGVQGGNPAAVIEEHHVSIPSEPSGLGGYDLFDHSVLCGPDGDPLGHGDVEPRIKGALAPDGDFNKQFRFSMTTNGMLLDCARYRKTKRRSVL